MRNDELNRIKDILRSRSDFLQENYQVKRIGVFGSVTRGEQKRGSDIDIMVDFLTTPGLFQFVRLERYLSRILGRKVDLVTRKAIKPIIKSEVLRDLSYV
ncbi:nucleotidyltransferase family protein [Patescibacteria group bacterium]|nr:nucleotidyltransferase family protein [Patescibacteria group bacterium]